MRNVLKFIFHPITSFFLILAAFYTLYDPYSPSQVTDGESIPFLLQGGTDWGGSNQFVLLMVVLFVFGITNTTYLSIKLSSSEEAERSPLWVLVKKGFKHLWGCWAIYGLLVGLAFYGALSDYFACESFAVLALFGITYAICSIFVSALSYKHVTGTVRVIVALAPLLILGLLLADGSTLKSGQSLNTREVPMCKPRSLTHFLMTYPQRFCPSACSGRFSPISL